MLSSMTKHSFNLKVRRNIGSDLVPIAGLIVINFWYAKTPRLVKLFAIVSCVDLLQRQQYPMG